LFIPNCVRELRIFDLDPAEDSITILPIFEVVSGGSGGYLRECIGGNESYDPPMDFGQRAISMGHAMFEGIETL
jgi:hypothetical protein